MPARNWKANQSFQYIQGLARRRMEKANEHLIAAVKDKLGPGGGARTGRIYGEHQASAPGEPPAEDTGALRASIEARVNISGGNVIGEIGTRSVPYAAELEFGTSRVEPRPFLRPTVNEQRRRIMNILGGR